MPRVVIPEVTEKQHSLFSSLLYLYHAQEKLATDPTSEKTQTRVAWAESFLTSNKCYELKKAKLQLVKESK